MSRYAPDLAKDPFYRWLTTYHWVPLTVLGFSLLAIGGWGLVNWAIFLRVVVGLHSTYLVNSATHMWGRRRFATSDDSRNLMWVALVTFGEGWHNNHHAHPVSSRHGLAWYEFDPTCCSRDCEGSGSSGTSRPPASATSHRKKPSLSAILKG
jgi:stearoyl-CoA desaturase (delta-9 desaturase)